MKLLVRLALALVATSSLHALDWGLTINQVPLTMQGPTTLYVESLSGSFWAQQPLFGADLKLQGDVSWAASSTNGTEWRWGDPSYDFTEASLKGVLPLDGGASGLLDWNLGRRSVNDLSGGWVLNSRWDGLAVSLLGPSTSWSFAVGYSGLLQKKSSKVTASEADVADSADAAVTTAPQRLYGTLGWGANELFLRQDVQWELLGDYDLRAGSRSLHGAYATLLITGPLPLGLRQKWYTTGGLRVSPTSQTPSVLTGGEISATIPFLGSRFVLSGTAAQGFGGYGFQPISGKGLADTVTLSTANGAAVGADFSLKPLSKTTLGVKGTALFRTTLDSVGLAGFDTQSTAYWLGTEAGLYASWTPTSETSFGANVGAFLPQSGAFVADTKPSILAVVTASLKL